MAQGSSRIIVIGSPGAGKSTLSRALAKACGLPLFHLDMIWHKPDGTNITRKEFDAALSEILLGERWIIDGNYSRTLTVRLDACDTVILLDYPTDVCIAGAMSRIGKKRADMPWVEREFDPEFKKWIEDFPSRELPQIYALLKQAEKDKNVIVLHSRAEADLFLKSKGLGG